jgi:hypothetical protein
MEIKSTLINNLGQVLDVIYYESDPLKDLDGKVLSGVHASFWSHQAGGFIK